jgi:3-deoxy-D-manno-octulosonic-acid transferase
MFDHDAAIVVEDGESFTAFVRRCLEDTQYAADLGRRAQTLVLGQLGATERTLQRLTRIV